MARHNSTYPKVAVQWLNQALYFYESLCLVDSEVLLNRQLRIAAKHYKKESYTSKFCYINDMIIEDSNIANTIKKAIRSTNPNAEVILYGSRARGDARIDSDWDILILLDEPVNITKELAIRELIYDIELEHEVAISIVVYSKQDWSRIQKITPFYENVEKEGIKI